MRGYEWPHRFGIADEERDPEGCTNDAEGAEWVGVVYAGMINVGLTGVDMNDAALEGSSAAPVAWQSGGEGQGSGNCGENHKHHA